MMSDAPMRLLMHHQTMGNAIRKNSSVCRKLTALKKESSAGLSDCTHTVKAACNTSRSFIVESPGFDL